MKHHSSLILHKHTISWWLFKLPKIKFKLFSNNQLINFINLHLKRWNESNRNKDQPDFLDENGFELASEVLGSNLALKVLASQDALLGVLDVVPLLLLDQPFDTARLHLPLHPRQRLLQVTVPDLHSDPPPLLSLIMVPSPTHWVDAPTLTRPSQ